MAGYANTEENMSSIKQVNNAMEFVVVGCRSKYRDAIDG